MSRGTIVARCGIGLSGAATPLEPGTWNRIGFRGVTLRARRQPLRMEISLQHAALHYTRPSFPLELSFSYSAEMYSQVVQTGTGQTVEIGSHQMRIRPITLATWGVTDFVLALDWPAILADGAGLQLVLRARTIEPGPTITRLRIVKYEFRTRRVLERSMAFDLRLAVAAAG